jgi:hypothetical protein
MQTRAAATSHGGSGLVYAVANFAGSDSEHKYWRVFAKRNGQKIAAQMAFATSLETSAAEAVQAYADQVFAQLDRKPIFPIAAKADDKLSRVASELWQLMRSKSQDEADTSAFGAPSECYALSARAFHKHALTILSHHGWTVEEFNERLDAVVDERCQYFRLDFGYVLASR